MTILHHARRAFRSLQVSLLAALGGCGQGGLCDPNSGEGPDVVAEAHFGLFDTSGTRLCPSPIAEPTYSVGRAGVAPTTERMINRQGYHARLTPDRLSYDILEGGPCNLTLGIAWDDAGRLAYPDCPDAVELHYTMEVPGCVPQAGVFPRDRFDHPATTSTEYRIPLFLDCDDTVARWPEGAPRPEF